MKLIKRHFLIIFKNHQMLPAEFIWTILEILFVPEEKLKLKNEKKELWK